MQQVHELHLSPSRLLLFSRPRPEIFPGSDFAGGFFLQPVHRPEFSPGREPGGGMEEPSPPPPPPPCIPPSRGQPWATPKRGGRWDPHSLSQLLQLRVHVRNLLLAVDDHIAVFKGLLASWEGWSGVVRARIPHALGTSCLRFPSSACFCAPPLPPPAPSTPPRGADGTREGTWGQGLLPQELLEWPSTLQIRFWGKRCF